MSSVIEAVVVAWPLLLLLLVFLFLLVLVSVVCLRLFLLEFGDMHALQNSREGWAKRRTGDTKHIR